MQVTNNTSYPLIAFGWHTYAGYGDDVTIAPAETKEVLGPYLGDMDDGACHVTVAGEISCHEGPDDDKGYQVALGKQLNLKSEKDKVGITVRHHSEPRIIADAA